MLSKGDNKLGIDKQKVNTSGCFIFQKTTYAILNYMAAKKTQEVLIVILRKKDQHSTFFQNNNSDPFNENNGYPVFYDIYC